MMMIMYFVAPRHRPRLNPAGSADILRSDNDNNGATNENQDVYDLSGDAHNVPNSDLVLVRPALALALL